MSYKDKGSKVRRSDDRVAALDRLAQYLEDHRGWNSDSARLRSVAGQTAALNESDRNEAPIIMTGQRLDFDTIGNANDPRLNKILMEMRGDIVKEAEVYSGRMEKSSQILGEDKKWDIIDEIRALAGHSKIAEDPSFQRVMERLEDLGIPQLAKLLNKLHETLKGPDEDMKKRMNDAPPQSSWSNPNRGSLVGPRATLEQLDRMDINEHGRIASTQKRTKESSSEFKSRMLRMAEEKGLYD